MSLPSHWTTAAIVIGIGMLYLVVLFLEEWLVRNDEGKGGMRSWLRRLKHG